MKGSERNSMLGYFSKRGFFVLYKRTILKDTYISCEETGDSCGKVLLRYTHNCKVIEDSPIGINMSRDRETCLEDRSIGPIN